WTTGYQHVEVKKKKTSVAALRLPPAGMLRNHWPAWPGITGRFERNTHLTSNLVPGFACHSRLHRPSTRGERDQPRPMARDLT
ncbi:MAG TPA: hypothetical protein VI895_10475, partial [Bdellovibrionota bacterium]|nr:hypothetical protein [Bdellovibrionota bacterium]